MPSFATPPPDILKAPDVGDTFASTFCSAPGKCSHSGILVFVSSLSGGQTLSLQLSDVEAAGCIPNARCRVCSYCQRPPANGVSHHDGKKPLNVCFIIQLALMNQYRIDHVFMSDCSPVARFLFNLVSCAARAVYFAGSMLSLWVNAKPVLCFVDTHDVVLKNSNK